MGFTGFSLEVEKYSSLYSQILVVRANPGIVQQHVATVRYLLIKSCKYHPLS